MAKAKPNNVDEYIAAFPADTRKALDELRAAIHNAAPGATEVISYGMPAFMCNGRLVWFAAHTRHIGFYPRVSAIVAFEKELVGYNVSKGTIRFPLDKPLPLLLIKKIVKFRVKENREKEDTL